MKYRYSFLAAIAFILSSVLQTTAGTFSKTDSVILGAQYANESYYSLSSGNIQTSPRATWDIAFRTMKMTSSILTNDGSGVILYTYPKSDTSGWASLDTTGIGSWTPMYNDPTDWENGAFSRNATGHPDYGWGRYNDVTHNLTGDSIFVIKLRDKSYRKLWITGKKSAMNIYNFKYANLDGTGENIVSLNLNPYATKDFYGFSLQTNEGVDFQPAKSTWDILFTRYMSVQPNGTPYPVVGILNNDTVSTKKFHPVLLSYSDFGAGVWDSTRSSIGWDWKVFDNNTFAFKIVDSTVYFVKPINGDIYKLVFTAFAGSSTGLVKFETGKAAGAGILNLNTNSSLDVFPNPASNYLNIIIPKINSTDYTITLTDLSGRQLRAERPELKSDGANIYRLDVSGVQPGIYFVSLVSAATPMVSKVIITR